MPDTKIQARQRKLNKKIGTTGTDPFIPARMPGQTRSYTVIASQPTPPARRRLHWAWIVLFMLIGIGVLAGLFIALRHWWGM